MTGKDPPLASFSQHTDYINCVAAAKDKPLVASAGLRAEVFLWDIQKAMRINEQVRMSHLCMQASADLAQPQLVLMSEQQQYEHTMCTISTHNAQYIHLDTKSESGINSMATNGCFNG